jgi:[ribosomal protein S5]-alanine N-acetyltransferase
MRALPNPITTLTTPRLLAEAITPSHYAELHRLYIDPLVVKTIASAEGKPLSEEKIAERIQKALDHWQQHGFGSWVFRLKKDGLFIGVGGLNIHQIDGQAVVGLGYAVLPDYWNQGFATEMAGASLQFGIGILGLAEIASWTLPTNLASQQVMEKMGFRYERDFEFAGLEHRSYRLVAGEWGRYHGSETSFNSEE